MLKPFAGRTHGEMKDVLLHPEEDGPKIHYYMIRGGKDKKNITIWETGLVGGEYIKTYGHYHVGKLDESYLILQGEGIVLLQKRKDEKDDEVESFYAIPVKKGDSVFISSGTGHLVVNTGKTWLVTSDDSPVNFEEADPVSLPGHADYEAVKKMHGFAYYVIEDPSTGSGGKPVLVKNENYKAVPEAKWLTPEEYAQKIAISKQLE